VVSIPIQLNGKTPIAAAFDDKIDAITANLELGAQPIAQFEQSRAKFAFERGITKLKNVRWLRD
jgi:hypothetical protein